jgi:hypothetical protein
MCSVVIFFCIYSLTPNATSISERIWQTSHLVRPYTLAARCDFIEYPSVRPHTDNWLLMPSSLQSMVGKEEAYRGIVQHTDLPSDEEITKVRCQCLRLQFGLVRVSAVVYVCLCDSAVGQLGCAASYHGIERATTLLSC